MSHLDKMYAVLILLDSLDRNWSPDIQNERDWNLWVTTLGSTQKYSPGGVGILYVSTTIMATVFPIPPSNRESIGHEWRLGGGRHDISASNRASISETRYICAVQVDLEFDYTPERSMHSHSPQGFHCRYQRNVGSGRA